MFDVVLFKFTSATLASLSNADALQWHATTFLERKSLKKRKFGQVEDPFCIYLKTLKLIFSIEFLTRFYFPFQSFSFCSRFF